MERAIVGVSRGLAVVASLAIVIMMVAIAIDVFMRNVTGASLPGMLEVAETSLVVAVFFGLAWAGVQGEHIAVTLLTDRLSEKWVRPINAAVWLIATLFTAWMLWGVLARAINATQMLEERFGILRWPIYPARWVIVVGVAALLLVALNNLVRAVRGLAPLGKASELEAAIAEAEEVESIAHEIEEAEDRDEHANGTVARSSSDTDGEVR